MEAIVLAAEPVKTDIISIIERALINPEMDVDKLQRLLDMQKDIMRIEAEREFNSAMARLQPKLPQIKHDGEIKNKNGGVQSTYAKYETVDTAIRQLYTAEGFSISFDSRQIDSVTVYTATLSHIGGHSKTASITLPADISGSKNGTQAMGSTVSYARRYLITMLFNIVTIGVDNDGKGGFIDLEQAAEIDNLIRETGTVLDAFLKYYAVGSVRELPLSSYAKAKKQLLSKKGV